jgi:Domain of unknown function (DUF4157)/Putative peptidoglycan binding domain
LDKVNQDATTAQKQLQRKSAFFGVNQPTPFFGKAILQAKLTINEPNDPYEQEADAVADKVIQRKLQPVQLDSRYQLQQKCDECETEDQLQRKEEPTGDELLSRKINEVGNDTTNLSSASFTGKVVQAKCNHCEEEDQEEKHSNEEQRLQKKAVEQAPPGNTGNEMPATGKGQLLMRALMQGEEELQRKAEEEEVSEISMKSFGDAGAGDAPETLESRLSATKGAGSSLPDNTRSFMEQSIGADFSGVKIHNDSSAVQMSKDINAQAFTHGADIYFNSGKYNPSSTEGQHLLAHELTHVVQQGKTVQAKRLQRKPVEEAEKYPIDYKAAKTQNLKSWYDQYKFFNLFKEAEVYPGSTPIAYANHVYELQEKLELISEGKWEAPNAGILEPVITAESTLPKLIRAANMYQQTGVAEQGLDTIMLERIYKYETGFDPKAPPLVSEYFNGIRQLELVNRNKYFYIQVDDRGEYVKRLQAALMALNYNLGSDVVLNKETNQQEGKGVFGKGTKNAVLSFQKDSGFEGKDVDGVVGQITLRLLDKRIGTPAFKAPTVAAGNAFGFSVAVTAADLLVDKEQIKSDLLKRTLLVAFPITEEKANVLIKAGWHWSVYRELTRADVDLGYKKVVISKTSYESVVGKIEEATTGTKGESTDDKIDRQKLDLLKTGRLFELNKQIKEKEAYISSLRMSGDPEVHGRDIDWNEIRSEKSALSILITQRNEELRRLGLTLEEYEKMQTDFIATFQKYAVITAFRMLAENEMEANIEAQHYAKTTEVAAIKGVMSGLASQYNEAEKLWWEGVSLEDTNGRDKSYYKSSSDYSSKNLSVAADMVIDTSDSTRYYTDENVAAMFKAHEKKASPYFTPWYEKEKNVVTTLQDNVKQYPILAFPKLSLRRNAAKNAAMADTDLQKMLLGIINGNDDGKGIKQNIEAVRKELASNPEKVWEMPIVILKAQYSLFLIDGVPVELIKAKQKEENNKSFWENVGLAILGLGLGLLALASGPVGWLALAASIGVGAYDAYRTYNEITFKKEAANTAIDPASALGTDDPSYFWFWVSLVSVGLDVFQAAKVIKSIGKGMDLAKDVTKGLSEAKAAAELRLIEAGGAATANGKAIVKEIQEIENALSKVKTAEFAENIKLLEPLKNNPLAVVVMNQALKEKQIVKAVTELGKAVEKGVFEDALKFYASVGRNSLDELPELMRLIKQEGLQANKTLMAELLSDPRAQRVLLDTQDPKFYASQFAAWEKAIASGQSKSFVAFLEAENLTTKLAADTKLADMFGEGFATLSNAVKNRQILRTIEPRLLDALNAGTLSAEVRKALEVLLHSDVLAQSTRLSSAQQRMLRELNLLGSVLETQGDFAKVVALLDNPASRRALWEGASQLAGKDKYLEIIIKANGGKQPAADVLDDLIRIGPMTDEGTIKSLLGEAGQQLRKALAANPEAVAVLKKCASPCLPSFITPEQVIKVAGIMKGKSKDELLRIREFLYTNRATEDGFKGALDGLEKNFAEALKDVKLPVLAKPAGFAVSDDVLRAITDLGLPVSELNKIMKKAATVFGGKEIMTDLLRVLQFEKNVSLKNFDVLIKGLGGGTDAEFRAARHLLDEAERFVAASTVGLKNFKYSGLEKADLLLSRFTLTELNSLMNARWSDGFVNSMFAVSEKLPGLKNSEIIDLIFKAGGGKAPGNLDRLKDILSTLKAPSATYDEAVKLIQSADSFAADVAKAMKDPATGYDAMIKLIWGEGVVAESGIIKVTESLGKSGSDAYHTVFQLGKGDSIARSIAGGGVLSKERWKVFRKVIDDSNIAPSIKNSIIGEMWTKVNVEMYKGLGYTVYREVEIIAGKVTARADIILEKGTEIIVLECKSGGAVYTKGQDVVYPLLSEGKFSSVMLKGDEALMKKFADPNSKIRFLTSRESEIIK